MSSKAIFLDRDGTVIRQAELLTEISKVKILPGVAKAIKLFNELGFLVITVSNQPVIARGLITPAGIKKMDKVIAGRLLKQGAKIDASYFCPHHPNATLKKYRKRCGCRKPGWGMLRQASQELGINLKKSWMIGDALIDMVAGNRAGTKTILVKTGGGHGRLDKLYKIKPDFIARNLIEATKIIKRNAK
jgi:D-glycero-D-manno-heptose 1,7-bisphosphate phosphatase